MNLLPQILLYFRPKDVGGFAWPEQVDPYRSGLSGTENEKKVENPKFINLKLENVFNI